METENFHVLEKPEREQDSPMECPYKKFKFDSDEDHEDASFVTTIEDPKGKDNSNGDDGGNHQEMQQAGAAEFESLEETGDVGSENGKQWDSLHAMIQ